jgi:hypothetical protein
LHLIFEDDYAASFGVMDDELIGHLRMLSP